MRAQPEAAPQVQSSTSGAAVARQMLPDFASIGDANGKAVVNIAALRTATRSCFALTKIRP